jgi:predicted PurR-regulated permease PerM
MNETQLLTMAAGLVACLFGLLCTILGWLGNKLVTKIDNIAADLTHMASELHEKLNALDRRVTVVETKCTNNHICGKD